VPQRASTLTVLAALTLLGCEAFSSSPPPVDGGTRGLAAESLSPIDVVLGAAGQLRHGRMEVPITGPADVAARDFVMGHAALFGIDQGAFSVEVAQTLERDGVDVVLLRTMFEGVEVEAGDIVIGATGGAIRFASTSHTGPLTIDVTPAMDGDMALARLAEVYMEVPESAPPELVIADVGAMTGDAPTGPELAWRVAVTAPVPETVYVSARDAHLLFRASSVRTGLHRTVVDASYQASFDTIPSEWPILINEDGVGTPTTDSDSDSVFVMLGDGYDYYWDRFGWQSYDDRCSPLTAVTRFSEVLLGPNAFWYSGTNAFYFTEGFVAADIAYHELGHATLDYVGFGAPVYAGQSGAVEEGLVDAFAAFQSPDNAQRWKIGEALARPVPDPLPPEPLPLDPLPRDLTEPTLDLRQVDHIQDIQIQATGACATASDCEDGNPCRGGQCICLSRDCDHGAVHRNSGILGHALYLAAMGGQHSTRPAGTLMGIGVPKLEQIVWAGLLFLSPHGGFRELRENLVTACQVLAETRASPNGVGVITYEDCGHLINAFASAGVGPRDNDLDSYNNNVDNCPSMSNPKQESLTACITDPVRHCLAFRYDRAFELFLEGADLLDTRRSRGDALVITARCAVNNQDFSAALDYASAATGASGGGGLADAYFIAEFAAERLGRTSEAETYGVSGIEAAKDSRQCAGFDESGTMGCADRYRSETRYGLESR